jgi:hypothetical protein
MEKKFGKEEKVSKNPFQWVFLRKAIVLNRIYAEIVVMLEIICCCASQNKTREIKTNSIGMFYKYFNSFII